MVAHGSGLQTASGADAFEEAAPEHKLQVQHNVFRFQDANGLLMFISCVFAA